MKRMMQWIQIVFVMLLSLNTVFAAKNPISWTLSNTLPSPIFVGGGAHQVTYTVKNELPFQLKRPLEIESIVALNSELTYSNDCQGKYLLPQEECTISLYLTPLVAGVKTLQVIVGAQGFYDNNSVPLPTLSTVATEQTGITIAESVVTALPATTTLGQSSDYSFEFANTGSTSATGVSIASTDTSFSTTCTNTLISGSSCTVSGVYTSTSTVPAEQTVSATFSYTQGTAVTESTETTVTTTSGGIVATTPVLLPSQIKVDVTKSLLFLFTNKSERSITITSRDITGPASGTFTPATGGDNCGGVTLAPGQACQLNGTYEAPSAIPSPAEVSITETVHYLDASSGAVTATASTSTKVVTIITDQRTLTFVNQCNFPVWFSMNGGAIPNSPACKSDPSLCPAGSTCNTGANQCYWNNNSPSTGSYNLTTTAPDNTATVEVTGTDASSLSDTLWSGNFSASTLCSGSTCGQAACDNAGGTTSCSPGVGFKQPATQAEITMLTAKSAGTDTYDVEIINGFHLPIKMEPNIAANNYVCGVPGNEVTANNFGACDWTNATPLNSDSAPNKYYWVTKTGTACTTGNTCADTKQRCGLDIDLNVNCGDFLGYFSSNELCVLDSDFSSPFGDSFSCQQNLTSPFPQTTYPLSQLLACPVATGYTGPTFNSCYLDYTANAYTSTELTQCCGCVNWWDISGVEANSNNDDPTYLCQTSTSSNAGATLQVDPQWTKLVQPTIQWIKQACPSVYTYPFDDRTSTFTCTQPSDYTVTFCPGGDTGLPTGLTEGRG
jgi:hypothetical protein